MCGMCNACFVNILKCASLDRESLRFFLPVESLEYCIHGALKNLEEESIPHSQQSDQRKLLVKMILVRYILTSTDDNHNETNHFLSVCYIEGSILGT